MAGHSFRFVHASDFHLEEAISSLTEVPDHLRSVLTDAPFQAATNVFEAAISERAEFLLLSGDLIQPELAGPGAIGFLIEQFERLAERDIAVYWATGHVDSDDRWPARVAFPENVHVFSEDRVEDLSHFRHDRPIATIRGRSGAGSLRHSGGDFRGEVDGPFQVGVAYGEIDSNSLAQANMDYWALGGVHQHKVVLSDVGRAEYAGSPQGRTKTETGLHGCVVGHVNEEGQLRTQLMPTDVVRWLSSTVAAGDVESRDALRRVLRTRMQEIASAATQLPTLVSWSIESDVHTPVHHSRLSEELKGWLREQFGYGNPASWTVRVDVQPPATCPEQWFEEDSILGDFLRAVHQQRSNSKETMDLSPYASSSLAGGELAAAVRVSNPAARARLLAEASLLGADLLRGDAALQERAESAAQSAKEEVSA